MAKWNEAEKSWERQPKESSQAFEAFNLYLRMGEHRSLRRVAQELGKSSTLISRWSSAWSWQARVRDYENELKRVEFEEELKQAKNMRKRQIQTAILLQKKAVEALDKLDISELAPKDILSFISKGAQLEREMRTESAGVAAKESGSDNESSSLADTIVEAYRKRMEGEGNA